MCDCEFAQICRNRRHKSAAWNYGLLCTYFPQTDTATVFACLFYEWQSRCAGVCVCAVKCEHNLHVDTIHPFFAINRAHKNARRTRSTCAPGISADVRIIGADARITVGNIGWRLKQCKPPRFFCSFSRFFFVRIYARESACASTIHDRTYTPGQLCVHAPTNNAHAVPVFLSFCS